MIDHRKENGVHVITMTADASTICPNWQQRMLQHLDTVEADCDQGAALVLAGEGKFFCNGLNLDVVATLDAEAMGLFAQRSGEIHKRFLQLPCPTVAAINGHAFAAGAFMAMSCDYRLMRQDRGWFCVSEVDVGVPIPSNMMGILHGKLSANTVRDAVLTGKRYTADEALEAGIVDGKAEEAELLGNAISLAEALAGKEPDIFKAIKQTWVAPISAAFNG